MSYRNNNRPASASRPAERAPAEPDAPVRTSSGSHRSHKRDDNNKRRFLGALAGILVGLLLLFAAWWFLLRSNGASAAIDTNKYQAVFFTNAQVYFGKLSVLNDDYFALKNVYYVQAKTNQNSKNPQEATQDSNQPLELIKLGNEMHGPEDEMIISKDQVLFFENLKSDGKVSQAIAQSQNKN